MADKNGVAIFDFEIAGGGSSTLFGGNALTDRSLVIHELEDDFGQPTGNAGSRLACGVLVKVEGDILINFLFIVYRSKSQICLLINRQFLECKSVPLVRAGATGA